MAVLKLTLLAALVLVFVPAAAGRTFARSARATFLADVPGFTLVRTGPDGGTVWEGHIPNREVDDPRLSDVYLPPDYSPTESYRVVYFLHGFWGDPSSFIHGMHFAEIADAQIAAGRAAPFIGVMAPGGPITKTTSDEWAGVWETFVVHDVIPWVDTHLPADPSSRAIAGLSAGGYGAVDIGLRHPRLFDTLESWAGYFHPFRDGPFVKADRAVLDAHDPTLLVEREAPVLRRRDLRFFLSTGRSGHGAVAARWTFEYADLLQRLHLHHRLWVLPAKDRGHLYRTQLPAAIDYASPPT
jgi:S-formylglutathione hydrolase FrmB